MTQRKRVLDPIDLRILAELQKNARSSFTEIGAAVCLSAPAVRDRIKQMEDDGLISGYKVVLDHAQLGKPIRVVNDNYTSSSATITLPPKERNPGSR